MNSSRVKKILYSGILFSFLLGGWLYIQQTRPAPSGVDAMEQATPLSGPGSYHQVPIFLFHNLDGGGRYSISRSDFRAYLELIKKSGVQIVSLKTLAEHASKGRFFEKPTAVITIDDDFKNIARVAAPLLREYGYPATIFVYINGISNHPKSGMSWEDLRRLHKEGFEIQSHSWTHTKFHVPYRGETRAVYENRLRREVIDSRKILEEKIPGNRVYSFAFPMGYYNDSLVEYVRAGGYEVMVTTKGDPADMTAPYTGILHRHTIEKENLALNLVLFKKQLEIAQTAHPSSNESRPTLSFFQ